MTSSNCCCLDCNGSYAACPRKHVAFCVHPDTFDGIAAAANAQRVAVHDFLIDAAWQRVREHRDQQAALDQYLRFIKL